MQRLSAASCNQPRVQNSPCLSVVHLESAYISPQAEHPDVTGSFMGAVLIVMVLHSHGRTSSGNFALTRMSGMFGSTRHHSIIVRHRDSCLAIAWGSCRIPPTIGPLCNFGTRSARTVVLNTAWRLSHKLSRVGLEVVGQGLCIEGSCKVSPAPACSVADSISKMSRKAVFMQREVQNCAKQAAHAGHLHSSYNEKRRRQNSPSEISDSTL